MCITISEAKIKIKKKQKHYHSLQTKASLENRKFTSRGFGSILHHYEVQTTHFRKKGRDDRQFSMENLDQNTKVFEKKEMCT